LQNSGDTLGITIPDGSYYVMGPWRRMGNPPRFLKTAGNNVEIKYTVLKCSGGICGWNFKKNL
jgi:hypothetical protein